MLTFGLILGAGEMNWVAGWGLVLAGFGVGAGMGMGFAREGFMGGYGSFERRLVRLGHVALVALGMLNVLFGVGAGIMGEAGNGWMRAASAGLVWGGILMPAVCFLTVWRRAARHLFVVPVVVLVAAVACAMIGGVR